MISQMAYIIKFYSIIKLYFRWFIRNIEDFFKPKEFLNVSFDNLEFIYINLDHRIDRKLEIENEFLKLGIKNFNRFSAIKNSFGALGCALSHKSVLEYSLIMNATSVICEDDAMFLIDRETLEGLISDFYRDSRLDVLCLAYNEFNKIRVGRKFYVSSDIQTCSCYLVKRYVLHDFCKVAEQSILGLSSGKPEENFAIDMAWKILQQKYFFSLPVVRAVQQRPSYSDIRNQEVSYRI